MRLTLRTLLAYLDDILEQDDTEVLKAKIQESALATQLITRIRNSVDHPGIEALSPDAIGPLENANVMGEYLDSTLPPEQIAEIERLCLESDSSLSEAAACHQILTMVLGQPAQVTDGLKQRIYALPDSEALRQMENHTQPAADSRAPRPPAAPPAGTASSGNPVAGNVAGGRAAAGVGDIAGVASAAAAAAEDSYELATPRDSAIPGASRPAAANAAASNPAASNPAAANPASPVTPVGPADSGVTVAASRLRESAGDPDETRRSEAEIVAGTTRKFMEGGQTDGNSGPSRLVPWLVTLAMAGVVLYALAQIFKPLSNRGIRDVGPVASLEIDNGNTPIFEPEPMPQSDPADAPNAEPTDPNVNSPDSSTPSSATTEPNTLADNPSNAASQPDTAGMADPAVVTDSAQRPEMPQPTRPIGGGETTSDATAAVQPGTTAAPGPTMTPGPALEAIAAGAAGGDNPFGTDLPDRDAVMKEVPAAEESADPDGKGPASGDVPVVEEVTDGPVVARLTNATSLAMVRSGDHWSRLIATPPKAAGEPGDAAEDADKKDPALAAAPGVAAPGVAAPGVAAAPTAKPNTADAVRSGQMLVAPALFRPILAGDDGLEWTLAGPTRVKLIADDSATKTELVDGRLMIASTKADVSTIVQLGPRTVRLKIAEPQTLLAVELTHFRPTGLDPLIPGNRQPVYRILAVQGGASLRSSLSRNGGQTTDEPPVDLATGAQWSGRGTQPVAVDVADRFPTWIDAPAKRETLVEDARQGLLEFVNRDQPIEKSLREAMSFRRAEVVALAAETLLLLGRADVYFGSDGILNRRLQRLYWTEHFQLLRQHVASDAQAAASVETAVKRAELADSQALFKLLVGFSKEELASGGDAKLVELLDSASMPVRVLAIENLKEIIGDSLGYRADEENANSRKSSIKTWEARLRKGDIR